MISPSGEDTGSNARPDASVQSAVDPAREAEVGDPSPKLKLEVRPQVIFAADLRELPFPTMEPRQDFVFDLGVTALHDSFTLLGVVVRGFAGHQLLFEQRWPDRILRQKAKLADLAIPAGTGIALRAMHFQMQGYEPVSTIELTVVAKRDGSSDSSQAILHVPVEHPKQRTDLHFPLEGTWWAIQAADWSDLHKLEVVSQPFALDFAKLGSESETFVGTGASLENHYSWNQPVYAAAGGKIAYAAHDMPDVAPGTSTDPRIYRTDPRRLLGNAVAISHANGEFSYYAHLRQASLTVRYGQMVRRGDLIGHVGNSGHTPGPHLHFHLMNGPNLQLDQGLPCKLSHFWAAGQFFADSITVPTRMIVRGPSRKRQSDGEI